ncbi:MAG: hypothetical protein ACREPG_07120, partial [Candidatus Binatia bacterium]
SLAGAGFLNDEGERVTRVGWRVNTNNSRFRVSGDQEWNDGIMPTGMLEYLKTGTMEYWNIGTSFHYSTIPIFQSSNPSFRVADFD